MQAACTPCALTLQKAVLCKAKSFVHIVGWANQAVNAGCWMPKCICAAVQGFAELESELQESRSDTQLQQAVAQKMHGRALEAEVTFYVALHCTAAVQ